MTKEGLFFFIDKNIAGLRNAAIVKDAIEDLVNQKAIAFAEWKDRYMNNPPIGKLASNEQLFNLFNSEYE